MSAMRGMGVMVLVALAILVWTAVQTFGQDSQAPTNNTSAGQTTTATKADVSSVKTELLELGSVLVSMIVGRLIVAVKNGQSIGGALAGIFGGTNTPAVKLLLCLALPALLLTGCFQVRRTQIITPAVFQVGTNTVGTLVTNCVTPEQIQTVTEKERLFVPKGYALFTEEDVYGVSVTLSGYSSTLPNVKAGFDHASLRLIPTSTNQLYAASMSESGGMQNKAVPFWFGLNGQFTTGPQFVNQGADTNGNATIMSTAIVPLAGLPR